MSSSPALVFAARNGMIGLAGSAVAAVAGLLLNVVVGRNLGVAAAGTFYVVVAVLTVVSTVSKLGADTAMVWALPRQRALGRPQDCLRVVLAGMGPVVALSASLGLLVFLGAEPLAARVVDIDQAATMADLLRWTAPCLAIIGPCAVLIAALRGLGSISMFALIQNVLIAGSRPLVVFVSVLAGGGLLAAVLAWNLPVLIGLVIAALVLRRMLRSLSQPESGEPRPLSVVAKEFWRFAGARSVAAIVEVGIVWADVLIVSALTGSREAGIYAAASRFITTGTLVEASMRVALAPMISSRLAVGDRRGVEELYQSATQWIIAFSWPLYVALACFADVLLSVFGPGFSDGAPALRLLAIAMLVATATGNSQTILLMSGRSGWQLVNKSLALILNIILNLLLVPRYGAIGAAVAWSVTIVVDSVVVLVQVRYLVGIRLQLAGLVRAMIVGIGSFGAIGVCAVMLFGQTTLTTVIALIVAGVLHAAILYLQRQHFDVDVFRAAIRRRSATTTTSKE